MEDAFHQFRSALSHVTHLYVPTSSDSLIAHTDGSSYGTGATLNVTRNENEVPVAFFAKQIQGLQHNYSATELEGLAVLKVIYLISHFLYDRYFPVVAYRGPNKRLQGLKLQDFHFDIS